MKEEASIELHMYIQKNSLTGFTKIALMNQVVTYLVQLVLNSH